MGIWVLGSFWGVPQAPGVFHKPRGCNPPARGVYPLGIWVFGSFWNVPGVFHKPPGCSTSPGAVTPQPGGVHLGDLGFGFILGSSTSPRGVPQDPGLFHKPRGCNPPSRGVYPLGMLVFTSSKGVPEAPKEAKIPKTSQQGGRKPLSVSKATPQSRLLPGDFRGNQVFSLSLSLSLPLLSSHPFLPLAPPAYSPKYKCGRRILPKCPRRTPQLLII